jgi:hypothetical protein
MQVRLIVAIAAFASFTALASVAFANCGVNCKTHCYHSNPPRCTESCECTVGRTGGGTPTQGNTKKHQ